MGSRKLPAKGTKELEELKEKYRTCPPDKIGEFSQKCAVLYGFASADSFTSSMSKREGVKREPKSKPTPEINIEYKIITPEVKEYIPKLVGKGDPETQVIVIGDDHAGAKTPSFNSKVYKKRFDVLFQSVMRITELHRNMYPLNDLVILDVGDNVQGENPYQGSTIGAVECGAVEQVYDLALPTLAGLLCSFKQEFKTIKFYGVRGNHGKLSRIAPQTSNWDLALYRALEKAKLPDGIEIHFSDEFNQIVEIEGFRFFVFHGDQIRNAPFGIPYFALIRAVKDWYVTFGGFPYAVAGHFHKEDYLRVTSETKLLINGALVTDDPYTLEQIKTSTIPNHWTFGVHKKHGISWIYSLVLDNTFLPHKQEAR